MRLEVRMALMHIRKRQKRIKLEIWRKRFALFPVATETGTAWLKWYWTRVVDGQRIRRVA